MKIHFKANKVWIFAPKTSFLFDHFWCENSNFIRFKVNFHAVISGFGAKIKIGEKLRISEHCGMVLDWKSNNADNYKNLVDVAYHLPRRVGACIPLRIHFYVISFSTFIRNVDLTLDTLYVGRFRAKYWLYWSLCVSNMYSVHEYSRDTPMYR